MSSNNALHVQKDSTGMWVGQEGSFDVPPNPDQHEHGDAFMTLEELLEAKAEEAATTEYGFFVRLSLLKPEEDLQLMQYFSRNAASFYLASSPESLKPVEHDLDPTLFN